MGMDMLEMKIIEFTRKGDTVKAGWLKNIDRVILPSQVKKIQQNDKSVLRELVLPKWVSWDFLYEWAAGKKSNSGRLCILCNTGSECGIDFMEKFVCENCFLKLKNLNQ
jgi:hypothetical protein